MSQTISPLQASITKLTGGNQSAQNPKNALDELLHSKQEAGKSVPPPPPPRNDELTAFHPSARGLEAAAASEKYQQAYGYSQTMNLTLKTKEGDIVQVDFRQLYAEYQAYQHEQAAAQGPKGARYFESTEAMESTAFEERFGFSVKGDLNQDELKAIYDVFDQVDALANQFFEGDIEEAFKQAQQMNIDFGQLSNVSLDLQKTEVRSQTYQRAAAYQQVQQATQPEPGKPETPPGSPAQLPPYLQQMQQVVGTLDTQFDEARQKADELFAKVASQRDPEQKPFSAWYDKVKSLHDQLAEMAKLDKITLKPSGVEIPKESIESAEKERTEG
ncbi:hypothetical protein [Galenea microaerophila]